MTINGDRVSLGDDKNVLELDAVMVAQHRVRTKCHGIVCFKMVKAVNITLCLFYHN